MRSVIIATLGLLAAPVASGEELAGLTAAARSILGADQGVYVETTKGTVLVAQAADKPVHPASVSKVPTALALLRKGYDPLSHVLSFAFCFIAQIEGLADVFKRRGHRLDVLWPECSAL